MSNDEDLATYLWANFGIENQDSVRKIRELARREPPEASEYERVIAAIKALPESGEGMTVGEMADRVDAETGLVVAALQTLAERAERRSPTGDV